MQILMAATLSGSTLLLAGHRSRRGKAVVVLLVAAIGLVSLDPAPFPTIPNISGLVPKYRDGEECFGLAT